MKSASGKRHPGEKHFCTAPNSQFAECYHMLENFSAFSVLFQCLLDLRQNRLFVAEMFTARMFSRIFLFVFPQIVPQSRRAGKKCCRNCREFSKIAGRASNWILYQKSRNELKISKKFAKSSRIKLRLASPNLECFLPWAWHQSLGSPCASPGTPPPATLSWNVR